MAHQRDSRQNRLQWQFRRLDRGSTHPSAAAEGLDLVRLERRNPGITAAT
jgi:hypothetical protein